MNRFYFNARSINSITPTAKKSRYMDDLSKGGVAGLGIDFYPSGKRAFFWRRSKKGCQRQFRIGEFPAVSVASAREVARELNVKLASDGFEPTMEIPTLKEFWVDTFSKRELPKKAASTQRHYSEAYLLLKPFHNRLLNDISRAEVAELIGELGMRSESQANKVRSILLRLFNFAIELDRIDTRPPFPKPFRLNVRDRYLDADEVCRLLKVLDSYERMYALYFQTVLFTGSRKNEVCCMRWDQVQLESGMWLRIQKGGSTAPTVLPDDLVQLLKDWKETQDTDKKIAGTPWVFPSTKNCFEVLSDPTKHWKVICLTAGIENATIHTLRHTHASWMAQDGTSLAIIGKQLGHRQTSTTERYAHLNTTAAKDAVNSITKKMRSGRSLSLSSN